MRECCDSACISSNETRQRLQSWEAGVVGGFTTGLGIGLDCSTDEDHDDVEEEEDELNDDDGGRTLLLLGLQRFADLVSPLTAQRTMGVLWTVLFFTQHFYHRIVEETGYSWDIGYS